MNAISFPNMLSANRTQIVFDKDATQQNLKYLLLSTKKEMLGDPYFGVNLKKLIFEKNNVILRDLVIDDIYTNIGIFMPQIRVERKNITVESNGNLVTVYIKAQNLLDYSFDEYSINLLNVEEL